MRLGAGASMHAPSVLRLYSERESFLCVACIVPPSASLTRFVPFALDVQLLAHSTSYHIFSIPCKVPCLFVSSQGPTSTLFLARCDLGKFDIPLSTCSNFVLGHGCPNAHDFEFDAWSGVCEKKQPPASVAMFRHPSAPPDLKFCLLQ